MSIPTADRGADRRKAPPAARPLRRRPLTKVVRLDDAGFPEDDYPFAGALKMAVLLTDDADAPVRVRLIDERGKREGTEKRPTIELAGSLQELLPVVQRHNEDGYAAYIQVNEARDDLPEGHSASAKDITKVRALFVDGDGVSMPDEGEWHVEPSFILVRQDDPDHWWAYWLVDDFPLEQFEQAERRMNARYGTDKSVHDLPRIARLPDFTRHKDERPTAYRLEDRTNGLGRVLAYDPDDVLAGLPGLSSGLSICQSPRRGEPVTAKMLREALSYILPDCSETNDGMRNGWIAIGGAIHDANVVTEDGETDDDFDGFALFEEWSRGDLLDPPERPQNYEDFDDCKKTWRTFGHRIGRRAGMGTIFMYALQGGYKGSIRVPAAVFKSDLQLAAVVEVNEDHAMIVAGPNKGKVADLSNPAAPAIFSVPRLSAVYDNDKVAVPKDNKEDTKLVRKSDVWRMSPYRREIKDIVFEPPGSPKYPTPVGTHNLWGGFSIEPKPGNSHERLLAHIRENVCYGNEDEYHFFISWLADLVQHPGYKPGTAVAVIGVQGCGKSVIGEYLDRILGPHSMPISKLQQLTGQFNAHLGGLILARCEEAFWAGDKRAESALKDLITGDSITVEPKGVDPYSVSNHVHVFVTSNEDWVAPSGIGDRRWAFFEVSPRYAKKTRANEAFWKPIQDAKNADGPANLLHFLLSYEYDPAILRRPPMTSAKVRQTMRSMSPIQEWWLDVLQDETSLSPELFEGGVEKDRVYAKFREWCDAKKIRRQMGNALFWRALNKLLGNCVIRETKLAPDDRGKRAKLVAVPSIDECRRMLADKVGCSWAELRDGLGSDDDGEE